MRVTAARARHPVVQRPHHHEHVRPRDPRAPLTVAGLLDVQQRAGNQAAAHLVAQRRADAEHHDAFTVQRSGAAAPALQPTVRLWSRGPAVVVLQDLLVQGGADLKADGIFGPLTYRAVVSFQRAAGLAADGIVGPQTWPALKAGVATVPPGPTGEGSTVATKLTARLRAIATHLRTLGAGAGPASAPFAPASVGGHAEVQRDVVTAAGLGPTSDVGSEHAPLPADLVAAAGDVLGALSSLPSGPSSELGSTVPTLQDIATDLVTGGPAAQQLSATLVNLSTAAADLTELAGNTAGASMGSTTVTVKEKSYKVTGTNSAEIGQELDVHMSTHGEAGHVGPLNNQGPALGQAQLTPDGRIKKVDITMALEREMPALVNRGSVCAPVLQEFDRFFKALTDHEQEHVNKFKTGYAGAHVAVNGKTEKDAVAHLDKLTATIDTAQATFDTTTEHGKKPPPGTNYDAGIPCQ